MQAESYATTTTELSDSNERMYYIQRSDAIEVLSLSLGIVEGTQADSVYPAGLVRNTASLV